jgi:hypothetical protein
LEKLIDLQGVEVAGLKFKPEELVHAILEKTPGNTWNKSMLYDLSMTLAEKKAIEEKAEIARLKKEADKKAEQDAMGVELAALMGNSELERGTSHGSTASAGSIVSAASGGSATGKKPKKKRAKKNGPGKSCSDCVIKVMEMEIMIKDLAVHTATIAALEAKLTEVQAENAQVRDLNASCTQAYEQLRQKYERLLHHQQSDAVTSQMDYMGMDSTSDMAIDSAADGDSAYESPDEL